MKLLHILVLLLITIFSQNVFSQNPRIFKSEYWEKAKNKKNGKYEIIDSTKLVNYHKIDFDSSTFSHIMYNPPGKRWVSWIFKFTKLEKVNNSFVFTIDDKYIKNVSFVRNDKDDIGAIIYFEKDITLIYSMLSDSNQKSLDSLNIAYINEDFVIGYSEMEYPKIELYPKPQYINPPKQIIKDFEYSEYWRKEAYKKTIEFINKIVADNKCIVINRGAYNSNRVQYIGNQGFEIKYYVEFDCNQSYLNQSYFWVYAFYIGYGKWDLRLIDQRLTH